jgi:hypothetical protein
MRLRRVALGVALAAWVLSAAAAAQPPRGRRAILARIEGYIGEKPKDVKPLASWGLSDRGRLYAFQVLRIRVLEGDISYDTIVTTMQPYAFAPKQVTFFLRGPAALLQQFAATPHEQPITLIGYLRLNQRQLNLSAIEPGASTTPTPEHPATDG